MCARSPGTMGAFSARRTGVPWPPRSAKTPDGVSALARLFGLLRPYRLRLACAIACMVVYSFTSTVWLALIQPFMAVLFAGSQSPRSAAPAAAGGAWLGALQHRLARPPAGGGSAEQTP